MATIIFNDLLDPTMIFLVAELKLTSMTCRCSGVNRRQLKVIDKFSPRVGDMHLAQEQRDFGNMSFSQDQKPLREKTESRYIQELPKIMISSR